MSFYIVPTPIGNLKDFSSRSIDILKNSHIILCEKKERALKLLNYFEIKPTLLIAYHDDKCEKIAPQVIKELENKKDISLISDAGTPLISDPGHRIIKILVDKGIEPISVPGPSSIISALILTTLDISNFLFLGFLPKNRNKIEKILFDKLKLNVPLVILLNSKELTTLLDILNKNFRGTFLSVTKEISKINEGTRRGMAEEMINQTNEEFFNKGEFTVTIKGKEQEQEGAGLVEMSNLLKSLQSEGLTLKQSVEIIKNQSKISKKVIYAEALKIWN
ncbi:rRNA small subunit methyltransferase 1 [bacterium]|jgi:16S rRNA (cytidine1402-2'-O)-methyltransferase|nr:rRNA small subunit methyltransferase 1 [bacterium]MBT3795544.1 rRNA small subunit methyltransferase 1 [bacterium]